MEFTYKGYADLLNRLKEHGYEICGYSDWDKVSRCAILRHDVDEDLRKALRFAEIEADLGVRSSFFVLLTSDFYNLFSANSEKYLNKIANLGHTVGLHFDEMRYNDIGADMDVMRERIIRECNVLADITGQEVKVVSMHRPGKAVLESDLEIPGIINSYGSVYFKQFKYLSDSRRRWREPIDEIIESEEYDRLHILTHAIWYDEVPRSLEDIISGFVNSGSLDRYDILDQNITELGEIMSREKVVTI